MIDGPGAWLRARGGGAATIGTVFKRTANEGGQSTTTGLDSGEEGGVVPLYELEKCRLLRPVTGHVFPMIKS